MSDEVHVGFRKKHMQMLTLTQHDDLKVECCNSKFILQTVSCWPLHHRCPHGHSNGSGQTNCASFNVKNDLRELSVCGSWPMEGILCMWVVKHAWKSCSQTTVCCFRVSEISQAAATSQRPAGQSLARCPTERCHDTKTQTGCSEMKAWNKGSAVATSCGKRLLGCQPAFLFAQIAMLFWKPVSLWYLLMSSSSQSRAHPGAVFAWCDWTLLETSLVSLEVFTSWRDPIFWQFSDGISKGASLAYHKLKQASDDFFRMFIM